MSPSVEGFRKLYLHRYSCLAKWLRDAIKLQSDKSPLVHLSELENLPTRFYVIGRINSIKRSLKVSQFLCQQYYQGRAYHFKVYAPHTDPAQGVSELYTGAHVGFLIQPNGLGLWYIRAVVWPGAHLRTDRPKSHGRIAIVSDVHVGADQFNEAYFRAFINDINEDLTVSHVLIVGDVKSGIGVYPGQHKETHNTIESQTTALVQLFKLFRPTVQLVMIPGNHCFTTGLGEPQRFTPAFIERLREANLRVTCYTNPAFVVIKNIKFMLYHGRVLDGMIRDLPHLTYQNVGTAMALLLKSRHLAPLVDARTVAIPTAVDYLLIDDLPHVFCTGHVHKAVCQFHQGVLCVNAGSFQGQTQFQKMVKLEPQTGSAVFIQCSDLDKSYVKRYNEL